MTKPDFWKKKFIKQVQKNEFIEVTREFCPFFGIWGCEQDCTNQEKHFHHLFQGFRPELLMPQQGWSSSPFCLWTWEPKLSQENCVSSAGICSIASLEIQRHKWINNSCFLVFFYPYARNMMLLFQVSFKKEIQGYFCKSQHQPAAKPFIKWVWKVKSDTSTYCNVNLINNPELRSFHHLGAERKEHSLVEIQGRFGCLHLGNRGRYLHVSETFTISWQ